MVEGFVFFMVAVGEEKKQKKGSNPSKTGPRSSVTSTPAQKEHRVASKNGASARVHVRTHAQRGSSRQASVGFVEKQGNRCSRAQVFEGLQGRHGPPCLHQQPQGEEHFSLSSPFYSRPSFQLGTKSAGFDLLT